MNREGEEKLRREIAGLFRGLLPWEPSKGPPLPRGLTKPWEGSELGPNDFLPEEMRGKIRKVFRDLMKEE